MNELIKGILRIKDIVIIIEEGYFAIEFSPNDYIKDIDLVHGQFILKRRKVK